MSNVVSSSAWVIAFLVSVMLFAQVMVSVVCCSLCCCVGACWIVSVSRTVPVSSISGANLVIVRVVGASECSVCFSCLLFLIVSSFGLLFGSCVVLWFLMVCCRLVLAFGIIRSTFFCVRVNSWWCIVVALC